MSILVKNLSVKASNKKLLSNISLEFRAGEMIAVVGENGAGKTTLINCLTGGSFSQKCVSINGLPVESYSLSELASMRAVLTQSNDLTFPFTVTEVVRLGLSLSCLSQSQQLLAVQRCLRKVDALHLKNRDYTTLSGGEKQRVQLARVLAQISLDSELPRYLFLDEPTSALDMKHQFETLKMLRSLRQLNIGVFIILHDINLAAMYCDKILLMQQGQLLKMGAPTEVLNQDTIKQGFGVDVHILDHPTSHSPIIINQSI